MLNFERRHEKLAPLSVFFQRVLGAVGIAIGLAVLALALGILGYHFTPVTNGLTHCWKRR